MSDNPTGAEALLRAMADAIEDGQDDGLESGYGLAERCMPRVAAWLRANEVDYRATAEQHKAWPENQIEWLNYATVVRDLAAEIEAVTR